MALTLRRSDVAGYLTYSDIQSEIQDLIDDDEGDVLTVIRHAIRLTYNRILSRYRGKTKVPRWLADYDDSLSTVADTRTTNLATTDKNVERIIKVSIEQGSSWYPVTPIDMEELESDPNWWRTTNTQRPSRFFHSKSYAAEGGETNLLNWFYMPDDAYDIRYWFEKRINQLSGNDDVPMLPAWAHPAIIYGATALMSRWDIRVKLMDYEMLYDEILTNLDAFSYNFVLNPPEAGGWGM